MINLLLYFLFIAGESAYSAAFYRTNEVNFSNPAAMASINNGELVFANVVNFLKMKFEGTNGLGISGFATSDTYFFRPYGSLKIRLTPKWVAGFSITTPIRVNIEWPLDSFIKNTSTHTKGTTNGYNPSVSYEVFNNPQKVEKLAVGAGLNFDYNYGYHLDFVSPFNNQNIVNDFKGLRTGWNVGLFYSRLIAHHPTFFDLAFFSQRSSTLTGTSSNAITSAGNASLKLTLPVVVYVGIASVFKPRGPEHPLKFAGKLYWSDFGTQETILKNTVVGTIERTAQWQSVWSYLLAAHYTLKPFRENVGCDQAKMGSKPTKIGVSLFANIMYETNFIGIKADNNVVYPGSPILIEIIGLDFQLTKELFGQIAYGHAAFVPDSKINNPVTGNSGKASVYSNGASAQLTWKF